MLSELASARIFGVILGAVFMAALVLNALAY
jgi:hypothetical protein